MSDDIYVGPAKVLAIESDGRARVQALAGGCATSIAEWAIPFHYRASPGDLLLVVGQHDRFWVTGIVAGEGESTMAFTGDISLQARDTMTLAGNGGVRFDSPTVRLETTELHTEAEQLVQRVDSYDAEVRGELDERCTESSRIIDEDDDTVAGRHETIASKGVRIDGSLLRIS